MGSHTAGPRVQVDDLKQKQQFQGSVYGPIALEIKLTNANNAAEVNVLETHVANRYFSCYVTEMAQDQDLLNRHAPCSPDPSQALLRPSQTLL